MHRRQFLGSLALAAGAVACGGAVTPAPVGALAAGASPPLLPLSDSTYAKRHARARALTREAGGDVLIATSGATSFTYLAGKDFGRSERLIALLLPVEGDAVIVAPSFEVERVQRTARVKNVVGWEETESPYAAIARVLPQARAPMLEPHTEHFVALALARAMPAAAFVDGTAACGRLRVVKDDEELARIRRAIAITRDVFDAAFAGLARGMTDKDIARRIGDDYKRFGVEGYALVQLGALSALPHGHPRGDVLDEGMVVLVDGGCVVDGYWSDITRTRWFGDRPSVEFREIHALVHDAQSAALEKVRPGVPAQEIDRAARRVIASAGHAAHFTHRLGHGLGMDGHEPLYMVEGNTEPLVEGCVFTVEPGIYLPGRFGVRIEDDVVCGARGGGGVTLLSNRTTRG